MTTYKSTKSVPTIRILSYNVNWGLCRNGAWNNTTSKIVQAIKEADADVVLLQETHDGWKHLISSHLKEKYPHQIFCNHITKGTQYDDVGGSLAGGIAALSKFEMHKIGLIQPKCKGSFFPALLIRVYLPPSKQHPTCDSIEILNVHLRPPLAEDHKPSISSYFSSSSVRKNEIMELYSQMTDCKWKIIAGDFNEGSYGSAWGWLSKGEKNREKFKDLVYQFHPNAITWEWPIWRFQIHGQFDHIFYSTNGFEPISCEIMTKYKGYSDHIPVVGTLAIKE